MSFLGLKLPLLWSYISHYFHSRKRKRRNIARTGRPQRPSTKSSLEIDPETFFCLLFPLFF